MCFVKGTLVAIQKGHKSIEKIEIGDEVLSKDVLSGEYGYKKVKNIFVNKTEVIIKISVDNQVIQTTENHPFYVIDKGWIDAKYLTCEDKIVKADGLTSRIEKIGKENLEKSISVYNFEVEDWHTYFVTSTNLLVHNDCSVGADKWHKGSYNSAKESLTKHFEKHGQGVEQRM